MRATPAQIAVNQICGHNLPMGPQLSLRERMQEGREMLKLLSGADYGYDLQKWHDHFKESREGGYTWNRTIELPIVMKQALKSEEWRSAANELGEEYPIIVYR